jgi:glycosyltransferase involved in cell wall biosynthesis
MDRKVDSRRCDGIEVSFLLLARNEEEHIVESLTSLLNQRHVRHEVLVTDDASTDNTLSLIMRAARRHDQGADGQRVPLTIHENPTQVGIPWSRNQQAMLARGRIIVFCEADARYDPDFGWNALLCFDHQPSNVAALQDGLLNWRTHGDFIDDLYDNQYHHMEASGKCDYTPFIFKRDVFLALGGYDTRGGSNYMVDSGIIPKLQQAGYSYSRCRGCVRWHMEEHPYWQKWLKNMRSLRSGVPFLIRHRRWRRLLSPLAALALASPLGWPVFLLWGLAWVIQHADDPHFAATLLTPPYRLLGGLVNFIGLAEGLVLWLRGWR